jgi:MoxR-like ATPase
MLYSILLMLAPCYIPAISVDAFSATTNESSLKPSKTSQTIIHHHTITDKTSALIDPLLTNALLEASVSSIINVGGLSLASNGIQVWRKALARGRVPTTLDFSDDTVENTWPVEPLFSDVCEKMAALELPRFALRHPEASSSILLSLLRITAEYTYELRQNANNDGDHLRDEEINQEDPNDNNLLFLDQKFEDDLAYSYEAIKVSSDEIANEVSDFIIEQWSGVVSGVNLLDQLFGLDNGILLIDDQQNSQVASPAGGFGLQDGVWTHTGWQEIPSLQNQITSMPELKDLLKTLGRRPTTENADKIQKFAPRKLQVDGGMGAQFDPLERESINGVTLSGSFSEMLPSEAVLLCGSSSVLRSLFMAKKLENKLLSYQMSGWTDVPSVPATRPLYSKRLPSAPGGPIIVCLDTSWSMSGMRELLSKAVVLACVSEAHKQGRDCQVVAFSTEHGTMEAGAITADAFGIQRLLDFLSHSFGGGTDVTGALKYAMTTLETDEMLAADILLISDGEIQDPPISAELMEKLDRLKSKRDVRVHGLLVGKRESNPMSRLCNNIYDFLLDYDTLATIRTGSTAYKPQDGSRRKMVMESFSSSSMTHKLQQISMSTRARSLFKLRGSRKMGLLQRREATALHAKRKRKKWDDDDYDDYGEMIPPPTNEGRQVQSKTSTAQEDDPYLQEVKEATTSLKEAAEKEISLNSWDVTELLQEKRSELSCWEHQDGLRAAVERVGEGLVEREEESRLVVLSMMAKEHILLLGVPGTGKSILGRRLAKLCSGSFFQRLLTRFTTPDELFGPLSLRGLENDEYRRCTTSFLPTASVAFLDEIFKANSAILNTLLTILNERKFDNAGGQEDCPIRCVVGASNELPESDELVALFDRFLIRKEVLPLSDEGVLKLLSMPTPRASSCNGDSKNEEKCDTLFTGGFQDVVEALSAAADYVQMRDHACKLMVDLRRFMKEEQNVELSDRRLVKASRLLKLSAASHGRLRVDTVDCFLLQHCMWQLPEQKKVVREWLWDNVTPGSSVSQFRFLLENLRQEIIPAIRRTGGDVSGQYGAREKDVTLIQSLQQETSKLVSILSQQQTELARHLELLRQDFLWIDPEELLSMRQQLLPRAESLSAELKTAFIDARSLELSLSESDGAPSKELRLSVIEQLWEGWEVSFTDDELNIGMKEAKAKYDLETFRKWKRTRKRAQK